MSRIHIDLHIDEPFAQAVAPDVLIRVAQAMLTREHRSGPTHASVTITDDETMRALNRDHRGDDRVTDVLSFGASTGARNGEVESDQSFPQGPDEEPTLGDVIVSFPQAKRQAEAGGHTVERELALLIAHGILHLLGFDHAELEEEKVMFGKQDAILNEVLGPVGRIGARS